ncbi:MAG: exonuclease domain-containing protein, partial [Bacteroidota bacterium]
MFAVVDIETTGGYASHHRITEVAVLVHDGQQVIERYQTLINPGKSIPFHITALTGISDDMVRDAPTFEEVAEEIAALTKDKVFVAHNVNFDYSFLKKEMEDAGVAFQRKKLCTVRMSRKLLPGLPSYSLGNLCKAVGIRLQGAHRAAADAEATTELLALLLAKDQDGTIEKAIKRTSREALLPPHVPRKEFEALPAKTGVYYFQDAKGKVLYVGKAKNIKARVTSHFSGKAVTWQKQHFMQHIHHLRFDLTGNELVALLLESEQIQKHWPRYNKAQKQQNVKYGIVHYEDRKGFMRLGVHRVRGNAQRMVDFHSAFEAREFLWRWVEAHGLCPSLCGLQNGTGPCRETATYTCNGACSGKETAETYNVRLHEATHAWKNDRSSFAIIGTGRKTGERAAVVVEKGKFLG